MTDDGEKNVKTETAKPEPGETGSYSVGRRGMKRFAFLVLLVVVVVLYVGIKSMGRRSALRQVSSDWGAYKLCLLGPPQQPAADERPVTMLRRIELNMPEQGLPPVAANAERNTWPERCQRHLNAIHATFADSSLASSDFRYARFDRLVTTATDAHARLVPQGLDDPLLADDLWEAANDAELPSASPSQVDRPAPGPAHPIEIWKVEPLARVSGDLLPTSDPIPSSTLHIVWPNEREITYGCTFSNGGAGLLATVACKHVGVARRWTSLAVPAVMDDAFKGSVVADGLPKAGLFNGDTGEMIARDLDESSFVAKDGSIVGLKVGDRPLLVRVPAGHAPLLATLPAPARPGDSYRLRWDQLLYTTAGGGDHDKLFARQIAAGDRGAGQEAIEVGPVPAGVEAIRACHTESALIVAVKGAAQDKSVARVAMAFRAGDKWLPPVEGNAAFDASDSPWGNSLLTCRGREATLTWRAKDGRPAAQPGQHVDEVRQLRCRPEGCASSASGPLALAGKSHGLDAADLDGKVLLVRIAEAETPLSGTTMSLRIRLAPIADLAKAADVVVLGDERHEGMTLTGTADLYVRQIAAVVLVRDEKVLRGLRIEPSGKYEGLKLEGPATASRP